MGGVQAALNATDTPKAIALGMEMGFCDMLERCGMLRSVWYDHHSRPALEERSCIVPLITLLG